VAKPAHKTLRQTTHGFEQGAIPALRIQACHCPPLQTTGKIRLLLSGATWEILIRTIGQAIAIRCSIIGCGTTSIYNK